MSPVGIILVNYRDYAQRFLGLCRDSLRQQNYSADQFIVYIVDNAGTAESRQYLETEFSEARIITRPDGNYSAANNVGIKAAVQDGCVAFVIANMDTVFDRTWLKELVDAAYADKNIGLVQSKILLYPQNESEKQRPLINTLGNQIHYLGFGFTRGYRQPDGPALNELPDIAGYASGCSLLIKKEVVDRIGYYNEEYYMYHDDLEYGWRAKLAGYRIVLALRSIVYHRYEFNRSIRMIYYMERNRLLAIFSHYHLLTLLLILPALVIFEIGMLFFSILHGSLIVRLRIYLYFLRKSSWLKIFANRQVIGNLRVKSDKEMVEDFVGKIEFQEIDNPLLHFIVNPVFNFYWQVVRKIIFW